jgi:antitoxin component YwqK of YwqJK toxin-antitoxin module
MKSGLGIVSALALCIVMTGVPAFAGPPASPPAGSRNLPPGMGPIPGAKGDTVLYWQGKKPIGWTVTQANGTQTHFDHPPDGDVVRYLGNDPRQPETMRLTFVKGNKTHAVLYQKAGVKAMEMDLKGDVQHGTWRSFHPNGKVRDSCSKMEGLTQGLLFNYDDQGKLLRKERYKDGKQEGITEVYYKEGPKQSETGYRAGMRHGGFAAWALNGSVVTRGSYSMGVPSGVWQEFHPNGQVRARSRLAEWRILERKCFHASGAPETCRDDAEEAKALEGMRRNWERERDRLAGKRPRLALPSGLNPATIPPPSKRAPEPPAPPPPDRLGK